jgi:hypothetical protein
MPLYATVRVTRGRGVEIPGVFESGVVEGTLTRTVPVGTGSSLAGGNVCKEVVLPLYVTVRVINGYEDTPGVIAAGVPGTLTRTVPSGSPKAGGRVCTEVVLPM